MDSTRYAVLIIFLLFLFLAPDSQAPTASQKIEFHQFISEEKLAAHVLNETQYGDFGDGKWLNLTGLREGDGYAWDLLPKVKERAREITSSVLGTEWLDTIYGEDLGLKRDTNNSHRSQFNVPVGSGTPSAEHERSAAHRRLGVYANVTGIVRGLWIRSRVGVEALAPVVNLSTIAPGTHYGAHGYARNISGSTDRIMFRFDDKSQESLLHHGGLVRKLTAEMTIKDDSSYGDGWDVKLFGVHYVGYGGLLLSTSSEK